MLSGIPWRAAISRTMSVTNGGEIPMSQPTNATVQINAFEYRPAVGRARAERTALRSVLKRFFGGSAEALVLRLIEDEQLERAVELAGDDELLLVAPGKVSDRLLKSRKRTLLGGQVSLLVLMTLFLGPAEEISRPLLAVAFFAIGLAVSSGVTCQPPRLMNKEPFVP